MSDQTDLAPGEEQANELLGEISRYASAKVKYWCEDGLTEEAADVAWQQLEPKIRTLCDRLAFAEASITRVRTIRDACTMTIVTTEDGKVPGKAVADWIDRAISPTACRECGCTDLDCSGCVERTGAPCYWVEPDLCSACSAQPVAVAS